MASVSQRIWRTWPVLLRTQSAKAFSTTVARKSDDQKGFFSNLFGLQQIVKATDAHSKVLTKTDILYEIEFNDIKPEAVPDYCDLVAETLPKISKDPQFGGELIGSWTTLFGKLDQAIHLWIFRGGYSEVVKAKHYIRTNEEFLAFARKRRTMLRRRENQLLHEFSFWGEPQPRTGGHIYELRSYHLKPGTLIEWGNNWGRAIHIRKEDEEAIGGFFSQIGELYLVHHVWAYKDLVRRKEIRENLWNIPGWDDTVANTVPLIRKMESKIMIPEPYSLLK